MSTPKFDYDVGDTIVYETFMGRARTVRVDSKSTDIKDGQPGFQGTLLTDHEPGVEGYSRVWGRDEQIIAVIEKRRKSAAHH